MKILSFKPGHDGSIAYLNDGQLLFSFEAEKDSFKRHSPITPNVLIDVFSHLKDIPDVIAVGGWIKGVGYEENTSTISDAGYYGLSKESMIFSLTNCLGKKIKRFSASHELSHLMCSYGMSPFEQGKPCYVLIWEGKLGDFYEIDKDLNIVHIGTVLDQPGFRYCCPYWVADNFSTRALSTAGKMMALASYSDFSRPSPEEQRVLDYIIHHPGVIYKLSRRDFEWSKFLSIGVESEEFKHLAGHVSLAIFQAFHDYAKKYLTKKYPLLISGGCGLNCTWNTLWKNSNLFSDVFVPPCANDSGSAIGTAIAAQFHYTGVAKIKWDVYCGKKFDYNIICPSDYITYELDYDKLARFIYSGKIIAWVQGRCEIGPRALCNRSLLASPFSIEIRDRLNVIKDRESYRPIAPVCLEEDVSRYFDWFGPSPHMLYFQKVKDCKLKGITHVDNTARVQTVNVSQNKHMYKLLNTFKTVTGFGVLCNTSLNFPGSGFINSMSDLIYFVNSRGIDGFVCNNKD